MPESSTALRAGSIRDLASKCRKTMLFQKRMFMTHGDGVNGEPAKSPNRAWIAGIPDMAGVSYHKNR